MTQPWVAIQRNPSSGTGRRAGLVIDLVRTLRAQGIRPRLYARREEFDAAVCDPLKRNYLLAAVAAGGDGTVLDLVNRHPDLPISILPLGTENLLAKAFGIPSCGHSVAEIIQHGRKQRIDSGWINNRRFLIMASAGFDADVVHRVHAARAGGHVRHWSYLRPIFQAMSQYHPPELRVTIDGSSEVHCGEIAVIANLRAYALNLGLVPTASGTDGILDVRLFRARTLWNLLVQLFRILTSGQEASAQVTRLTGKTIRIESDIPVPVQVDGDPAGMTPLEFRIEPDAVEFIVPKQAPRI